MATAATLVVVRIGAAVVVGGSVAGAACSFRTIFGEQALKAMIEKMDSAVIFFMRKLYGRLRPIVNGILQRRPIYLFKRTEVCRWPVVSS